MRIIGIALVISVGIALADRPPYSLTPDEMKALQEPIMVGHRILDALSRYSKASDEANVNVPTGLSLLTHAPTIEVLHAAGYISDSDFALAQRYHAMPQPVPANQGSAARLTMQTERGKLVFDTRGEITLHQHE